jgi:hypothetical protein
MGLYCTYSTRVSVPASELAPPAFSHASECACPIPLGTKGVGGPHSHACEGAGAPIRKNGEKVWYRYRTRYTLCLKVTAVDWPTFEFGPVLTSELHLDMITEEQDTLA